MRSVGIALVLLVALAWCSDSVSATETRTLQKMRVKASALARHRAAAAAEAEAEVEAEDTPTTTGVITPVTPTTPPAATTPAATPAAPATPATPATPTAPATPPAATTPTPPITPPPTPANPPAAPKTQKQLDAEKRAADKKAKEEKKAAEKKAKEEEKAKKKAEKEAAQKAKEAKKAEEKKKKAEEKKQKDAKKKEAAKKKAEEKKKAQDDKNKAKAKAAADAKKKNEDAKKKKADAKKKKSDDKSKTAIITHDDNDEGTWKTVKANPWPPHNLKIKSWVLSGVGSTNIKLHSAEGGYGTLYPSPLILRFAIGWDSHLMKLVENYKERAKIDGVLYYVAGDGKAVAKLSFERAVISGVKWPRLYAPPHKKSGKPALITVVLQPAESKVERILHVADAPAAPEADMDKMNKVERKDFKVDIEAFDTSKIVAIKLPTIVMNLKRRSKFRYDKKTKKQVERNHYRVTRIKKKSLFITVKNEDIAPWQKWRDERPQHPKTGTIEITQPPQTGGDSADSAEVKPAEPPTPADMQPLITHKFVGLFLNKIQTNKKVSIIELAYDSVQLEHHHPE